MTNVTAIADVFVDPPLVISSIVPSSSTLFKAVGKVDVTLLADPVAAWLKPPPVITTPPISKEMAAVPVVTTALCVIILIIFPPSGTATKVDDPADTFGITPVIK
jgi:hypothetical protein